MTTTRRTFIKAAVVAASTPAAAFAPPSIGGTLAGLIERHKQASVTDRAAWNHVADVNEALDTMEGRIRPKVHVSNVLTWDGQERVTVPRYASSEEGIRKVVIPHMEGQMAMAGNNEALREKIRASYEGRLNTLLADLHAQQAASRRQEEEAGEPEATAAAKATADVVRAIETDIIAFVPATLEEAAMKAAWVAWAYADDWCYIFSDGDPETKLVEAFHSIARAREAVEERQ